MSTFTNPSAKTRYNFQVWDRIEQRQVSKHRDYEHAVNAAKRLKCDDRFSVRDYNGF